MASMIKSGAVHHIALTVSDPTRSEATYGVLGFKKIADLSRGPMVSNGTTTLALLRAPEPARARAGDRFDENRVGLDHLSLSVSSRADLEQAMRVLDENHVPHGQIDDMGAAMRFYTLTLRDPDNIQVELSAPYA